MKKLYLFAIEFWWWLEHRTPETLAIAGYKNRKKWEHKYVAKFKENIYGEKV